jgi:putative N6-adenine-specific DNA methylase
MQFFATAAKGTEPALRDELRELRLRGVRADRGGVHFAGELMDGARACLWSRIAVRVLLQLSSFEAKDGEALYAGVRAIDWSPLLTTRHTLAVKASCKSSHLTHTQFIAQKTKDAIVDQLRDKLGERPSVDRDDPDLLVTVHLARDQATVYADLAGDSLHRRGYRTRIAAAPLKETLAAAILRLSGWDRASLLADPMCGAGTIAIEAAAWSRRIAPGIARERFGFERWANADATTGESMKTMRGEARAQASHEGPSIFASDADEATVRIARMNADDAGVDIRFERRDARSVPPLAAPGFIVTNPPYGERVQSDRALYEDLARAFSKMHGSTVALLAGAPALEKAMGMKPDRWWILYNGPIECRLLVYGIP